MNVTTRLTIDGLVRALRGRMHKAADEAEAGYVTSKAQADLRALKHDASNRDDDNDIIRD